MNPNDFPDDALERPAVKRIEVTPTVNESTLEEIIEQQTKIISQYEGKVEDIANPYMLREVAYLKLEDLESGISDLEIALKFLSRRPNQETFNSITSLLEQARAGASNSESK